MKLASLVCAAAAIWLRVRIVAGRHSILCRHAGSGGRPACSSSTAQSGLVSGLAAGARSALRITAWQSACEYPIEPGDSSQAKGQLCVEACVGTAEGKAAARHLLHRPGRAGRRRLPAHARQCLQQEGPRHTGSSFDAAMASMLTAKG